MKFIIGTVNAEGKVVYVMQTLRSPGQTFDIERALCFPTEYHAEVYVEKLEVGTYWTLPVSERHVLSTTPLDIMEKWQQTRDDLASK